MRFDRYPYGSIAWIYDGLTSITSRGQIRASKRIQMEAIRSGDRVLYAGVGGGEELLWSARFGARVTGIDLSEGMLNRLEKKLDHEGLQSELICGDVSAHQPVEPYDVVVANYFLNLFDLEHASVMAHHLTGLVRPNGILLLTDFALPKGGAIGGFMTEAYYRPINWIAWALGYCALHPILDYARLLEPLGFRICSATRFPVFWAENPAFVSIVAERRNGHEAIAGGA